MKNKLLTNFNNKKDPIIKEKFHTNYKQYSSSSSSDDPASIKASLGAGSSTLMLAGLHADLRNIEPQLDYLFESQQSTNFIF